MLVPSCLTASSIPQSGSTACSISATPHSPNFPLLAERLCLGPLSLRSPPPPEQTRLGEALELEALDPKCTYPSTQNGRIHPNPEKGNANLNSQIESAKSKSSEIKINQDKPYHPIHPQTWLALTFDKLPTDVASRRAHTCQALQWIWPTAVRASGHHYWPITRP